MNAETIGDLQYPSLVRRICRLVLCTLLWQPYTKRVNIVRALVADMKYLLLFNKYRLSAPEHTDTQRRRRR